MKTVILLFWAYLTLSVAFAQADAGLHLPAAGRQLADFIPAGYRVLPEGQATGDLNRDGRPDVALVLGSVAEDTVPFDENLPPRLLLVLFRTPTGYLLAAQARRAVFGKADGGVHGDPFSGIAIKSGTLLLMHDGGSSWGRTTTAKFRYQQSSFFLIGEMDAFGTHTPDCDNLPYPPRYDYRDSNFVTGEVEIIRTSEECQLLVKKRSKNTPKPLRKLDDYAVGP